MATKSKTNLGEYRRLANALRASMGTSKDNVVITADAHGIEMRHNTKGPNHNTASAFYYTEEVVDFCRVFGLSHYVTCGIINDTIAAKMRIYGHFDFDKED